MVEQGLGALVQPVWRGMVWAWSGLSGTPGGGGAASGRAVGRLLPGSTGGRSGKPRREEVGCGGCCRLP